MESGRGEEGGDKQEKPRRGTAYLIFFAHTAWRGKSPAKSARELPVAAVPVPDLAGVFGRGALARLPVDFAEGSTPLQCGTCE